MAEEYWYQFEDMLVDWFRARYPDPETRATAITDEIIATAGQTEFETSVGDVQFIKAVRWENATLRRGYDYTVEYPDDLTEPAKVIFNTPVSLNDEIEIDFEIGHSWIDTEYSRRDNEMPRAILTHLTSAEVIAGLGELMEDGLGTYVMSSWVVEVRSTHLRQAKRLASQMFNSGKHLRRELPFRFITAETSDLQEIGFEEEKNAYTWTFQLDVQWELKFADNI